jgi:capsular exopolysaccharide family
MIHSVGQNTIRNRETGMNNRRGQIDFIKLALYILKRCWLVILCAAIGCGYMYWSATHNRRDTYTASGTMYVYNSNPNLINYQYTSSSDLYSAVKLIDTYMVVVKSNKVMDVVVERLIADYPNITNGYVAGTLSMGSVSDTGVLRVSCVTDDPQKSADICNAVLDVAPSEIIRVVGAGKAEPLDYAVAPKHPNSFSARRRMMIGALGGAAAAAGLLAVLYLLNRKVADSSELTDSYTPPVLASVKRDKRDNEDAGSFMLTDKSPMDITESYAKLRMNLLYTLVGKDTTAVEVTSAIAGEGKSTITANLAISCAMSGKKVLLIDADMRRACQREIFHYSRKHQGLSNVLIGECEWQEAVMDSPQENLSILAAGHIPPNPAELLGSEKMHTLLEDLQKHFDLILLDAPPVNIVSDPLALSDRVAGCLFVVRQNFSDHREIRKALTAAELTGMNVLGFAFYGEKVHQGSYYYSRKYYHNYYHKYDTRRRDAQENKNSNK